MKSKKTLEDLFAEQHLPLPALPLEAKHYTSFKITAKKVRLIKTIDFTNEIMKHALKNLIRRINNEHGRNKNCNRK